jgi:hypothetical protein
MIARVCCTGAGLLLAGFGFFADPVEPGPLAPFGILFLAVSGVLWFGWEMFAAAYAYREEVRPNAAHEFLQGERLGPMLVGGLIRR